MAEAVVSFVLEKFINGPIAEAKFLLEVKEKVEDAKRELRMIWCFLKDADARARNGDETLALWVQEINDAAYDLDDVVSTVVLKQEIAAAKGVVHKVVGGIKTPFELHDVGSEIDKICNRLSELNQRLERYGVLRNNTVGDASSSNQRLTDLRRTYSCIPEHDFVESTGSVKALVSQLTKEGNLGSRVVSIHGMGGLGKTTLAKMVYHDKNIRNHFNCFAWVFVSQQFQPKGIWKGVLLNLVSAPSEKMEIKKMEHGELAKKLYDVLQKQKCLVVLDDVWKTEDWDSLKAGFPKAETRSKILITTRRRDVGEHADTRCFLYQPPHLDDTASWELLKKKAYLQQDATNLSMAASSAAVAVDPSLLKCDVFISFGNETGRGFASHLYAALRGEHIKAYMDEVSLEKGGVIPHALTKAMEESAISIIIFSENYASSAWCLDELVHILKCREEKGQIVLPIFLGIDPSYIRRQSGTYAAAFVKHEERFKDKLEKVLEWRGALTRAAEIAGWDSRGMSESRLVGEVVERVVFRVRRTSKPYGLVEKLGKSMVKYCGGLPLAIVILGGLLSTKHTVDEWKTLEQNVESLINKDQIIGEYYTVFAVLGLSYDELPYLLKPCLLHLANFPEDYEMNVKELCQLWIAEGFVPVEDKARECLMALVDRGMVQVGRRSSIFGRIKTCRIHDLMRDLCLEKAKNENFFRCINFQVSGDLLPTSTVRRLAVHSNDNIVDGVRCLPNNIEGCLRSLLCFAPEVEDLNDLMKELFNRFNMLRVFKFEFISSEGGGCRNHQIPEEIGKLIHLRLLSLKDCDRVFLLPSSMINLRCLQTLDLRTGSLLPMDSSSLRSMSVISKLDHLRHLYLPDFCDRYLDEDVPRLRLDNLTSLEILVNFNTDYCELDDLSQLTKLTKLSIKTFQTLGEMNPASNLQSLLVHTFSDDSNRDLIDIVSFLSSYPQIQKLRLDGKLVNSLEKILFPNLVKLTMGRNFLEVDPMPILAKLSKLRILTLDSYSYCGKKMVCCKDGFPQLESLSIIELRNLEEWRVEEGALSKLCHLEMSLCSNLKSYPDGLRNITTLKEIKLTLMEEDFMRSFDQKGSITNKLTLMEEDFMRSFDQKGSITNKLALMEEYLMRRSKQKGGDEDCHKHRSSKIPFSVTSDCWGVVSVQKKKQQISLLLALQRNFWKVWPGSMKDRVDQLKSDISAINALQSDISAINALLPDAEEKKFNDTKISGWLKQNQQFMIHADKVLDEFECQQLRRQVQNMYGGKRRKVHGLFLRSNPIAFRLRMTHKVRKLSQSLDKIVKKKDELHLEELNEEMGMRRDRRTCADVVKVSDDDVVGRDSDKKKLIDLLLCENEDTPKVHVVSIVGVGGMGKTTLARLVYNDEGVKNHFELKMWVCNSDNVFNVGRLLKEILDSATGTKNDGFTYDQLHTHLRGLLKNKRFLLILDEMQNEDRMKWSELNKFLVGGSRGSRILVTTRSEKVAEIMRSNKSIHTLQGLSKEDSETLFLRYSFDQGKLEEPKKLWDIGKQMVERCKGVPLAVKILASLLHSKREDSEWEGIRDHYLWSRKQNEEDILSPVLLLSYNVLPAHLRPCFVCSSFSPKGCRFSFQEVLDVCMARGLVGSADQDKSVEQVCKEYLDQLIFRSLIEQEEEYTYYMHDLIHDFALQLPRNKWSVITSPTQAVSCEVKAIVLRKASEESVLDVLSKRNVSEFKNLRMLDLCGSSIEMLPSCIGKLRHLRSLNLCANQSLKRLPNSIWKLQSLEILRLDGCKELEGLAKDIRKMISLKILTITTRATYLPDNGIECLISLQSLEIWDCKNLRSLPSDMFRRLTALERLEIHDCPRLDISQPNAENHLNKLRHLTIDGLRKMMTLPHFLKESSSLCNLKISRCPIKELPEWMTDIVESISIEFCPNLNSLPQGMTSLISSQKLKIKGCPGLKTLSASIDALC